MGGVMVDFFANMAGQVLQSKPQVQPLLPPTFAPWPGVPAVDGPTWPPKDIDAPAQAEDLPLPPPLVAPGRPDIGAPLPTFAQLRRAADTPPHPLPSATQLTPHLEQEETRLESHAADDLPHSQPETPQSTNKYEMMGQEVRPMPHLVPHPAAGMSDPLPSSTTLPGEQTACPDGPYAPVRSDAIQRVQTRPVAEIQPSTTSKAAPAPAKTIAPTPAIKPMDQTPPTPLAATVSEGRSDLRQQAKVAVQPLLDGSPAQPVSALVQGEAGLMQRRPAEHTTPTKPETPRPDEPIVPVNVEGEGQPGPTSVQVTPPVVRVSPRFERNEAPTQQQSSRIVNEPSVTPVTEPTPREARSALRINARILAAPRAGEPQPAHTVRVTIGRVVVRASLAAERVPTRRVELPRPPISLEEYLEGRQGGER